MPDAPPQQVVAQLNRSNLCGHTSAILTAWILPSMVASLLSEGEQAWNAAWPPY